MTDERKDEIWAMLKPQEKDQIADAVKTLRVEVASLDELGSAKCKNTFDNGYTKALIDVFGYSNIFGYILCPVTQAEEKPKGESDGESDDASCGVIGNLMTEMSRLTERVNSIYGQTWNQYRLDLAKELAVAMIHATQSCYPIEIAALANEIVKRLKETEE